jgi:hypothetical protein
LEGNQNLRAIIRQSVLTNAPPEAPGHSKYDASRGVIVVYDKGVYHRGHLDREQFQRSIFHELAHSILEGDDPILDRWTEQTSGDGFVDEYAKTNSAEDFCDTFSEFFIFPEKTQRVVPRKWRFLYNLMQSDRPQEKTAMHLLSAFTDELTKVAMSGGAMHGLKDMVSRAVQSKLGKGLAVGGAGVVGGGALGLSRGKRSGYDQGTGDVAVVAQKALQIGRQQGAQIGYQYAIQQMKGQQKQAAPIGGGIQTTPKTTDAGSQGRVSMRGVAQAQAQAKAPRPPGAPSSGRSTGFGLQTTPKTTDAGGQGRVSPATPATPSPFAGMGYGKATAPKNQKG